MAFASATGGATGSAAGTGVPWEHGGVDQNDAVMAMAISEITGDFYGISTCYVIEITG